MCGICGIIEINSQNRITRELLHSMCEVLNYRGPDGEDIYIEKNQPVLSSGIQVGLGHRRLAIIDLQSGNQPMSNEDGTVWIVQNGEIYNFQELKKTLEEKGHKFKTRSDTEVIIHLYEDYGKECVNYLRGMFAFAIWDSKNMRFMLARDRIGKKPLCYAVTEKGIVFASEIKSILKVPGIRKEINKAAIHHYLTYQYIPSPDSIFCSINKLPAAHILCWEKGKIAVSKYWSLNYDAKIKITEQEACEKIIDELKESTRLRLISDVPLGAFLSGGVDSSAVVATMSIISGKPVKTFSIGFEEQDFSELKYARMVAERYKTEHKELIVKPPRVQEILPKLAWYYNEPFADSSAIPTYYVSKMTKEYVTVALNGDGGDENFAGYPRYQERKLIDGFLRFYQMSPFFLKKSAKKIASDFAEKNSFWRKLNWLLQSENLLPERRYVRFVTGFPNELKEKLYAPAFKQEIAGIDSLDLFSEVFGKTKASDFTEKIMGADVVTYLSDCLCVKMDIASSANALETRSPFLDHKFMEFNASLPSHFKLKRYKAKYILKKALEKYLPKEVLYRPKMGFGVPITHWLKGELKDYAYEFLLSKKAEKRGYFNLGYIKLMLDDHTMGRRDHTTRLWTLIMLEMWHQVFIDANI